MRRLPLLALLLAACATSFTPPDPALYETIRQRDAEEFARFNAHDLAGVMSFFADDLEFYHDKDGMLTRAQLTEGFTRLFAQNNGMRRDLTSVKVYPIGKWGALEVGTHRFCHVENGRDDCGTFEFTQVWKNLGGEWKVTRALSYGH